MKTIERKILKKIEELVNSPVFFEYPLNVQFGDFALCLSPFMEKRETIKKELLLFDFVESVKIIGPYLNIWIKRDIFLKAVVENNEETKTSKEKILLEYISPNTNKPLHLGHVRNGVIGMALSNILEAVGNKVIKINLVNDRGEHICKSMLAYKKWGEEREPDIKGDHFVGNFYVKYNEEEKRNPSIKEEVSKMLYSWEKGDKETVSLWKKMNFWVYSGFEETYNNFGFQFDNFYYESELYNSGKEIIERGIEKGFFYRGEEGDILFDLPEEEFGLNKDGSKKRITLLRKEGTSLYITQDIGVALKKMKDYNPDKSIYITGTEQVYHFRCLFKILKVLGYDWAEKLSHLPYGMVNLPEGKMKSREGKVVDADNLLLEVKRNAEEEIEKRYGEKFEERALKIALGAIKFQLLSVCPERDVCFEPEKSISFEGATGPYCQYAYARTRSILEKSEEGNPDFSLLKEEEIILARKLARFEDELKKSAKELNPSRIANYLYELSKEFNRFYAKYPVLTADGGLKFARISLVLAVSKTLKKSLDLLGIPALEKM